MSERRLQDLGDFNQPREEASRSVLREDDPQRSRDDPHTKGTTRGTSRSRYARAHGQPRRAPSTSRSRSRRSGSASKRLANPRSRSKIRSRSRGKPDYQYRYY